MKYRIVFLALLLWCDHLPAQSVEDVVLKAMQDELKRNLDELGLPGYDKPFFILYGVTDQKNHVIAATLGTLTGSQPSHHRVKRTTRVLVGDYAFNDESLENNLYSNPTMRDLNLPLDDDYMGIRRAFWSTTDNVYRDAARIFEKHKETLKEIKKSVDEIPHRSFASHPPVTLIRTLPDYTFDKSLWEERAREYSAVFLQHESVVNSMVVLVYTYGYNYIANSEGTLARLPVSLAALSVMVQGKTRDGVLRNNQLMHLAENPDGLPPAQQILSELEKMIDELEQQDTVPHVSEEYVGPVLLLGPAVADLFSMALMNGRESIFASDIIPPLKGVQYTNNMAMDNRIGKSITHEALTIKAKPKLQSFGGNVLLGAFEMDNEGVVPPDEFTLLEKGVLKGLLNNRTLTHPSQTANGFGSGPGVVEVTLDMNDTEHVLKEKLLAEARREGLEYAFIVRRGPEMGMGVSSVYKVSVQDGSEELVRNASWGGSDWRTLRRIMGATNQLVSFNKSWGRGYGLENQVTSFIVPSAVLLKELQIRPFPEPYMNEEDYVSNPLK